jgi:hypothetical protein
LSLQTLKYSQNSRFLGSHKPNSASEQFLQHALLEASDFGELALLRYNANGSLDTTVAGGKVITAF